jgi:hypothetical protein
MNKRGESWPDTEALTSWLGLVAPVLMALGSAEMKQQAILKSGVRCHVHCMCAFVLQHLMSQRQRHESS